MSSYHEQLPPIPTSSLSQVLQLYDLSSEDITDWRALVDYVALLLTDRTTTTPAVALMMRVEVSAPAFAATLLPCSFLPVLIASFTSSLAQGLDEHFSKASILGELVAESQEKTAEAWVSKLGREYQASYRI